jgi:hypothetical protein
MGYCTEQDITKTIAQSLTSATATTTEDLGTLGNLLNVGNTLDKNLITTSTINWYIQLADQEIDGLLSELYKTPFCETVNFEDATYSDMAEYNDLIVLEKPCPLAAGDIVILKSGSIEERHEISEVVTPSTFDTVDAIQYFFPAGSRILRVAYPPPIRFISARLASANIYDKYFTAESSANVSTFGEKLRELGFSRLNDVLNGTTILHGQHRIGRRFFNPNLVDQYALPSGGTIEKGQKQIK